MKVLVLLLLLTVCHSSPVCDEFECSDDYTCLKLLYQCLNAKQERRTIELSLKVDRLITLLIMAACVSASAFAYKVFKDTVKSRCAPLRLVTALILWVVSVIYACVHSEPPDVQLRETEGNSTSYQGVDGIVGNTPM